MLAGMNYSQAFIFIVGFGMISLSHIILARRNRLLPDKTI